MVAANPLFRGGWSWKKKLAATVLNDIWPEVLFFAGVATMVATVNVFTEIVFFFKPSLLGVLGTVLGLVISFRTSSAYERYQEGRKMWTNIITFSRNLAQLIWLYVPTDRPPKEGQRNLSPLECTIEKKTMINLIQAFAVSVKHYLRGESGVYYQDLYPLICFLPRYTGGSRTEADMLPMWHASEDGEHPINHDHDHPPRQTQSAPSSLDGKAEDTESKGFFGSVSKKKRNFDPEQVLPTVHVHRPLKPSRNPPPSTVYDYIPFLRIWKVFTKPFRTKKEHVGMRALLRRKEKPQLGDSNVPIEISLFLHNYINFVIKSGIVQPAAASALVNTMGTFQDTISNLERIGNTPLPFAYQAHLRMSLWLYLFFLPFQIYTDLKWLTIPATAFAAFLFLGFLEIGQEIENPFNYDLNDLDLDSFCLAIQRELHEITAHTCPDPADFIFSSWNQPFAPADRRTAADILRTGTDSYLHPQHSGIEPGMGSLRRTLLQGWKDVDTHTRE
ncbi:hypothetical protein E1B28_008504 [Marasmius oreades]|uniref:Uncharacterized protein n=1 Tax=Marasmius oreades TaxID=181124 RepID=A0A9P7RYP3_9AGAR|nr:uncharacterized protein E1B28_008504 [Marasmius oreades]KAG7092130.1 hypothetical protein E1B28_008504 [Marasmius oreades]